MKPMLIRFNLLSTAVVISLLSACTPVAPYIDSTFGNSISTLKTMQTIDPNAAENTKTATLEGGIAVEVAGRYKESYKKPPPPANAFTIGIGK